MKHFGHHILSLNIFYFKNVSKSNKMSFMQNSLELALDCKDKNRENDLTINICSDGKVLSKDYRYKALWVLIWK